jgi:hypothetical protein
LSDLSPPGRRRVKTAAACLCLAGTFVVGAGQAIANGDPASHVLPSRELFLPDDPDVCSQLGRRLAGVIESANRDGYRIKVGVVRTGEDLGTEYALFGRPNEYARFLARELPRQQFLQGSYRLLIVMPQGLGLYNGSDAESRALKRVSITSGGGKDDLGRAAIRAVTRLARARGHPLESPKPTPACPEGGSGSGDSSSSSSASFLMFAAPALLLIVAGVVAGLGRRRQREDPEHD